MGPALVGLGILIVAALIAREVAQFRSGTHIITRRAYVLRLINSGLLLVVLGMMLYGMLFLSGWASEWALVFWSAWFVLFFAFIILTINDLRMLRQVHHDRREELRRRIRGEPENDGEQGPEGP